MDFWDLTKVLVRRWYLAVPGLVLTLAATGWLYTTVKPNYIATSLVQVALPISRPPAEGQPSLEQRNPWMDMGAQTLANTAMLTLQQPSALESLKSGGFSDTFTSELDQYAPVVTFKVTGASPEQAVATTDELFRRFSASVTDLQVDVYGVAPEDLATAKRIDVGNNIEESNANVKRAAVAVAGVGLVLTFALTVGFDALAGRRARRRSGGTPGLAVDDLSPLPAGPAPATRAPQPAALATQATPGITAGPVALSAAAAEHVATAGPALTASSTFSAAPTLSAAPVFGTGPADMAQPEAAEAAESQAADADREATVVLPLTYRPARRQSEDRGAGLR